MQWRSEETLAAYEHYFDQQRHDDTRDAFHQRMHEEVERYLKERRTGKQQAPPSRKDRSKHMKSSHAETMSQSNAPDLAFLYSLAGEQ
jgi:hypothetical protein